MKGKIHLSEISFKTDSCKTINPYLLFQLGYINIQAKNFVK